MSLDSTFSGSDANNSMRENATPNPSERKCRGLNNLCAEKALPGGEYCSTCKFGLPLGPDKAAPNHLQLQNNEDEMDNELLNRISVHTGHALATNSDDIEKVNQ